jgi:predicted PurR-regulated permease PerM
LTVVLAFVALLLWGVFKVLAFASGAIVPLIVGFFLALLFKPYYLLWRRMLKNPTLSLTVMLLTIFVPVSILLWYAGSILIDQASNLIRQGPELINHVLEWFRATFPKLNELMGEFGFKTMSAGAFYDKYAMSALQAGTSALKCLFGVVSVLVTLIFFVFFLMTKERRGAEIACHLPFLKDDTRTFVSGIIDSFIDILVSFFRRQTVICLIEGVMYGTGFWLVGLPFGFLVGFALGVMNLIPFFGSVVCLPIALPLAYFAEGGSATRLAMVLSVWLAGQFLDGYFITPKIQGDKTGIGYAGVIFSFFFWATVLGPLLGMLLAIPLSAFCVVTWRAVKAKYIKPVV